MVTEMITMKLEDSFLGDIDSVVKQHGYQNRTEFIRAALREKIEDIRLREVMLKLDRYRGTAPKKTTDKERERVREKVFQKLRARIR